MPAKLAAKLKVTFSQGKTGKYPWDDYFKIEEGQVEGDQWSFEKGVADEKNPKLAKDFTTDVASFRNTASTAARNRGLALHTQTTFGPDGAETGIVIQAYKPTAEQLDKNKARREKRAANKAAAQVAATPSAA